MQGPSRHVAVIDDDEGMRDSLVILLSAFGYKTRAYASAQEFLGSRPDAPACLIVDQVMPGMTGIELAAQLRREKNRVPILLISGWISAALASNAAQVSVETLIKPLDETLLLSFVERSSAIKANMRARSTR